MTDKKKETAAEKPAEKAPVAAAPAKHYTDGPTEGKTHPIKVWREGDTYDDFLHDLPTAREVTIGGVPFDHAGTTADGVWIYRNDRKN